MDRKPKTLICQKEATSNPKNHIKKPKPWPQTLKTMSKKTNSTKSFQHTQTPKKTMEQNFLQSITISRYSGIWIFWRSFARVPDYTAPAPRLSIDENHCLEDDNSAFSITDMDHNNDFMVSLKNSIQEGDHTGMYFWWNQNVSQKLCFVESPK